MKSSHTPSDSRSACCGGAGTGLFVEALEQRLMLSVSDEWIDIAAHSVLFAEGDAGDAGSVKVICQADGDISSEQASSVLLTNGLVVSDPDYFAVEVVAGGSAGSVLGGTVVLGTTSTVYEYVAIFDVSGTAYRLDDHATDPVRVGNAARSTAHFGVGGSKTLDVVVTSEIVHGTQAMINRYEVAAGGGLDLNTVRLFQYLDSDILSFSDDLLQVKGSVTDGSLVLDTIDPATDIVEGLTDAGGSSGVALSGFAADEFSDLRTELQAGGFDAAPEGTIDTVDLPPFVHTTYGNVYGPDDITVALEYEFTNASEATLKTQLGVSPFRLITPVIVVPDMFGSLPTTAYLTDWLDKTPDGLHPENLAPEEIRHTYEDLFESLNRAGYQQGVDYFFAAYDWRAQIEMIDDDLDGQPDISGANLALGNLNTGVEYLAYWIDQARDEWIGAGRSAEQFQVDIIAHGMGGLVTRDYMQSGLDGAAGEDHVIRNVAILGAPNHGTIFSYKWNTFEVSEEGMDDVLSVLAAPCNADIRASSILFGLFLDMGGATSAPVWSPSVVDTLPTWEFYDALPDGDPQSIPDNEWLLELNDNLSDLTDHSAEVRLFALEGLATPAEFNDLGATYTLDSAGFGDGMTSSGRAGTTYLSTDVDLPLFGVTLEGVATTYQDRSEAYRKHSTMPTDFQEEVFDFLGVLPWGSSSSSGWGADVEISRDLASEGFQDALVLYIDNVDFILTDPQGRRIGYTAEAGSPDEIPGAFYSGDGQLEYVVVPDELSGVYQLELIGTGQDYNGKARVVRGGGVHDTLINGFLAEGASRIIEIVVVGGGEGEIRGGVWDDADGDGVWDAGEPGLENWTVYLDQNQNDRLDVGETSTTTDGTGAYAFTDLSSGTYYIAETAQPGWQQTLPVEPSGELEFENIASSAGVDDEGSGSYAAVLDYDGDGDLDLYVVNDPGSAGLYRNNNDETYTDVTALAGVTGNGVHVAVGDYDNDGDPDVLVSRGAGGVILYRNNGDSTFTDVTAGSGIGLANATRAGFGDYDNDGFDDFWAAGPGDVLALLRSNGDGTFSDVTAGAGLSAASDAEWIDYDRDGDVDLFSAGAAMVSKLHRNNGDGTFTDVSSSAGVGVATGEASIAAGDYNGDSWVDIYIFRGGSGNLLWRNNRNGTFTNYAGAAGLRETNGTGHYDAAFGDFDNDGDLDLYVTGGRDGLNNLFRNNSDGTFEDVTATSGLASIDDTRAIVVADMNSDGLLDVFEVNSTAYGSSWNRLWKNVSQVGSGFYSAQLICYQAVVEDMDFGNQLGDIPPVIGSLAGAPDPVERGDHLTLEAHDVVDADGAVVSVGFYRETNEIPGLQLGADGDTLVGTDSSGLGGWTTVASTTWLQGEAATFYALATGNDEMTSALGAVAESVVITLMGPAGEAFGDRMDVVAGDGPRSLVSDDFNGDGLSDAAVVNTLGNSVSVLYGQPGGGLGGRRDYAVGNAPRDIVSGDFNGDGRLDLAVANMGDNDVSLLWGLPGGVFGSRQDRAVGAGPVAIVAGDFNNDGRLDLATANYADNTVTLLYKQAVGGYFGNRQDVAVGRRPSGLVAGDFNGDGRMDLAAADFYDDQVSVLWGQAGGGVGNRQDYAVGSRPAEITAADFNGDGRVDLATANYSGDTVTVLYKQAADGYAGERLDVAVGTKPTGLAAADFNEDGRMDLAVTSFGGGAVRILWGLVGGGIGGREDYAVGRGPMGAVAADFNDDGLPDLAVANFVDDNVSVLFGRPAGQDALLREDSDVGDYPRDVVSADFNNDGLLDLASINNFEDTFSVLYGQAGGGFAGRKDYEAGGDPRDLVAGDFNGDGRVDLAAANFNDGDVSVLWGLARGGFGSRQDYAVGAGPVAIVAADFNNDGLLDLATANYSGNTVTVLLKSAVGGYFTRRRDIAVGSRPSGLVSADFNNDGRPDLATANFADNDVSLLWGLASGSVGSRQDYAVGSGPIDIAAGDWNGDGRADLAVSNYYLDSTVTVLYKGAVGGYFKGTLDVAVGARPGRMAGADFDNDGFLDIAVPNADDHDVSVVFGQAGGGFANRQDIATGGGPVAVIALDLNNDNRIDLVTANAGDGNVSVIYGQGGDGPGAGAPGGAQAPGVAEPGIAPVTSGPTAAYAMMANRSVRDAYAAMRIGRIQAIGGTRLGESGSTGRALPGRGRASDHIRAALVRIGLIRAVDGSGDLVSEAAS